MAVVVIVRETLIWLSVGGWTAWGWRRMQRVGPGVFRLGYWLATLTMVHCAASHSF